jgi:Zn-dependent peptidase ImmA (M78 family)
MAVTRKPISIDDDLRSHADRILRENAVTSPPVPVTSIAQSYGFEVAAVPMPQDLKDLLGVLDWETRTIFANNDGPPEAQNATVARLFAHGWLEENRAGSRTTAGIIPLERRPVAAHTDEDEREADTLAAYLLIPPKMLERFKLAPPSSLARIFVVPEDLIRWRLTLD